MIILFEAQLKGDTSKEIWVNDKNIHLVFCSDSPLPSRV